MLEVTRLWTANAPLLFVVVSSFDIRDIDSWFKPMALQACWSYCNIYLLVVCCAMVYYWMVYYWHQRTSLVVYFVRTCCCLRSCRMGPPQLSYHDTTTMTPTRSTKHISKPNSTYHAVLVPLPPPTLLEPSFHSPFEAMGIF